MIPDSNECTSERLLCADLCLSTPTGPVCACATGYEPDVQLKNLCNPITNFTQVIPWLFYFEKEKYV